MERLTKIYPSGAWGITGKLDDAILRLATYEDTGLDPKEIDEVFDEYNDVLKAIIKDGERMITNDRLRELAEADREGRCVVLPRLKPGHGDNPGAPGMPGPPGIATEAALKAREQDE